MGYSVNAMAFAARAGSAQFAPIDGAALDWRLLLSIAILESGYGQKVIGDYNVVGMKCVARHSKCIEVWTTEEGQGRVKAKFADFGSLEECFADVAWLLARSAYYREARRLWAEGDKEGAIKRGLASYATDSAWGDKIWRIYLSLRDDLGVLPVPGGSGFGVAVGAGVLAFLYLWG